MLPKVTLVNPPTHVLETVWILWEASKVDGDVDLDVHSVNKTIPQDKLEGLFWQVLRQHIPVAENIHFTFMLEGISVSLREQMVRHRIGTGVGPNIGVDIVPDLASSSWWSQSMRIQDMGTFADREMYRIPESLKGKMTDETAQAANGSWYNKTAEDVFQTTMDEIQHAYRTLVRAGVPMEDARELIPLGAQHRISWDINLQALLHVLGKRGCWILQLGIWGPIIHGMVQELVDKVHPMFARIVAPPCIDQDNKFRSCQYRLENERRVPHPESGEVPDSHPPCPLWLCRDEHGAKALDHTQTHGNGATTPVDRWRMLTNHNNLVPRHSEMKERAEEYRKLWKRDPYLWEIEP